MFTVSGGRLLQSTGYYSDVVEAKVLRPRQDQNLNPQGQGLDLQDQGQGHRLAVWVSGNALASINVVALRHTRLVPGWVTVYGRVNRLSM